MATSQNEIRGIYTAGENLSSDEYHCGAYSSGKIVATTTQGELFEGIIVDPASADADGKSVTLITGGHAKARVSGTPTEGVELTPAATSGELEAASSNDFVGAILMEDVGTTLDVVRVRLTSYYKP